MARQYFGTDGVRGVVGEALTDDLVERLGRAFARWTSGDSVLVGRDTRASGPALEVALVSGLARGRVERHAGRRAADTGRSRSSPRRRARSSPPPTIPAEYNGIKLFRAGLKLEDPEEEAIEALLDAGDDERPRRARSWRRRGSASATSSS